MSKETSMRFVIAEETLDQFGLEVEFLPKTKTTLIKETGWKKTPIFITNERLPSLIAILSMIKDGRTDELKKIIKD